MTELYHAGITVGDLDRSVAFYRDVVGMTEALPRTEAGGQWMDRLKGYSGARVRVAHLTLGGFMLQLVQYVSGGGGKLVLGHHHVGNPHLSIYVDDVDRKREEIRSKGAGPTGPIVTIGTTGRRSFYTADPDGVPVEFMEKDAIGGSP